MCLSERFLKSEASAESTSWPDDEPTIEGQSIFMVFEFWEYQEEIVGTESQNSRSEVKDPVSRPIR